MARTNFPYQNFQDPDGNPLAFGVAEIRISHDVLSPSGQLCSGMLLSIALDSTGTMSSVPQVWPNTQLTPEDSTYILTVYTAGGQRTLGPLIVPVEIDSDLVLIDISTGGRFTLSITNGSLVVASGGSGGVSNVVFVDGSSTWSLVVTNGELAVLSGGTGGVSDIQLSDTATGQVYSLAISGGEITVS